MISLLIGLAVLVLVVQVLRWFAHADVKSARKAINWGGIAIIAMIILFLALTGRMAGAIAGAMALMVWGIRILSFVQMGRQFTGLFRSARFSKGAGAGVQSSEVDSAFLRMHLDHDTGAMDGEVKQGRFQGCRLTAMKRDDLLSLLTEVSGDPDSTGLLEAFMDRAHPEWREASANGEAPGSTAPQGAITADEAYRILGLKAGASDADIKAAYRRLMGQLHPDHGGSDYLAAKVNQAKDFLLKH